MASPLITPELFRFLRSLARNNNREWFEKNKQRYIDVVRDPLCAFVEVIGPKLRKVAPTVIADPRPNGGSLFRIYRDTRFSKDKTPYKTAAALSFRLAKKDIVAPSFYLGIAPGDIAMGAGIYYPAAEPLRAIREAIVAHPERWKRVSRRGLADFGTLKRAPKGFDPDHPLVSDLKHKSFCTVVSFDEKQACAGDFQTRFVRACRQSMPLLDFLSGAVGFEP